jgi:2-phosphosulfolactate phosphatase
MATTSRLRVHYLPQFVAETELAGSAVVVIDQLRASSTVCYALAAGAKEVVPLQEVDAVLAAAHGELRHEVLLGGERAGERIEGFDLGNSPAEYTAEHVYGKRILFTTTNGTRALHYAHLADHVYMGCAANASAVAARVAGERRVEILCAGTDGHVTRDDQLIAGLIAELVTREVDVEWELNDEAEAMRREWHELLNAAKASGRSASDQLVVELRDTQGGRNLLAIGHDQDLEICGQIDTLSTVPELDRARGCLVAAD